MVAARTVEALRGLAEEADTKNSVLHPKTEDLAAYIHAGDAARQAAP
jgi:hypothetical protein